MASVKLTGAEVTRRRTALGISRADLARESGLSQPTITSVEDGRVAGRGYLRGPSRSTLVMLETALSRLERAAKRATSPADDAA